MAAKATPRQGDSLISLDAAIAREIIVADNVNTTHDPHPAPSTPDGSKRSKSRRGAALQNLDTNVKNKSREQIVRKRNNSLRNVKNSKELLRNRSLKKRDGPSSAETILSSKEGKNFTVGNVGTGGLIYLRPSAHQLQSNTKQPSVLTPPMTPTFDSPSQANADEDPLASRRYSAWSTSQTSEMVFPAPMSHSTGDNFKQGTVVGSNLGHRRTQSFSTHGSQDVTASEGKGDRTFRIVIDRSSTRKSRRGVQTTLPALEVPIPHYKLGMPRFSSQGTLMLRSSAYTRDSAAESDLVRSGPHLSSSLPSFSNTLQGPKSAPVRLPSSTRSETSEPTAGLGTLETRKRTVPVDSAIFDGLKDDPSNVRYSVRTGAIVAATPARIIAQISSEAFMDYDLVSDFFLTFRSYLSTFELLELLMARLHWAINRLQEDGRIIRIRTFAALRHWILNYFMDDFVADRPLRVEFCDQINKMYREVQRRVSGGTSDLKILQDLKRCWNGRCSLYWDSPDFAIDSHQEVDIVPGGVMGCRDSSLIKLQLPPEVEREPVSTQRQERPAAAQSWFGVPAQSRDPNTQHQQSAPVFVGGTTSVTSGRSLQPISCSIPAKVLRRSPRMRESVNERHPRPSKGSRQNSPQLPATSTHAQGHSSRQSRHRSGSFSDSIRDQESPNSSGQNLVFVLPHAGSLIRGNVFSPGSPYIDVTTRVQELASRRPLTPYHRDSATTLHEKDRDGGVPQSPGAKTIMGSIRRALSQRQTVNGNISRTVPSNRERAPVQGKTSTLPLNVARSNDTLRTKLGNPTHRTHIRIDLLCAAIYQNYQTAVTSNVESPPENDQPALDNLDNAQSVFLKRPHSTPMPGIGLLGEPRRLHSHVTAQSGSIVIIDGTRLEMPVMSGALPASKSDALPVDQPGGKEDTRLTAMSISQSTYLGQQSGASQSHQSSPIIARGRSNSLDAGIEKSASVVDHGVSPKTLRSSQPSIARSSTLGTDGKLRSTATTSTTLRRYASYQSSMSRKAGSRSLDLVQTTDLSQAEDTDGTMHLPAPTLRRRPGGDLRKIQNIHDLEAPFRPQSNASGNSASDSAGGSLLIMANRQDEPEKGVLPPGSNKPVSLIHTHSSQHLRPSFEAAVSGFSTIPDDDDGGLEATLLKLEGRYEKKPPVLTADSRPSPHIKRAGRIESAINTQIDGEKPGVQSSERLDVDLQSQSQPHSAQDLSTRRRSSIYGLPTESIADSQDSDISVPLLERGLADDSMKKRAMLTRVTPSFAAAEQTMSETSHPSIEVVEETDSMKRIPKGLTVPVGTRSPTADSFLLDSHENLSDLSSELSVDIINHSDVIARNPSPLVAAPGTALSGLQIPTHPLAHPSSSSSGVPGLDTGSGFYPMMYPGQTLTPDPSPIQVQNNDFSSVAYQPHTPQASHSTKFSAKVSASTGHIPFVLAFDSEVLAEQMTLVEKAALSEVEWNDLVDMRWDTQSGTVLNWVDVLTSDGVKGIDLVITRFNLCVKWVLSEVVLTQDLHERAAAITKFIHVAAHARRLRNYATMLQITIALTSIACTRLTRTWEVIASPTRSLLKNMEALVQPLRNFHDLRTEMESSDLTKGCIPFVGLYVHDLTYNAQKPVQIAVTRDGEPLINFERYRTTASIVKGLLRLIDASSKYEIQPVEDVTSRCLWMAALSDEKIQSLSKSLE